MKKFLILTLTAALALTLYKTNPSMDEFGDYYEEGNWQSESAFLEKLPAGDKIRHSLESGGQIRKDYKVCSVYDFGGRLFLGIAGDFMLLAQ